MIIIDKKFVIRHSIIIHSIIRHSRGESRGTLGSYGELLLWGFNKSIQAFPKIHQLLKYPLCLDNFYSLQMSFYDGNNSSFYLDAVSMCKHERLTTVNI